MKYLTKHCQVCGKQFVVTRKAAHKGECFTLRYMEWMDSRLTTVSDKTSVLNMACGRRIIINKFVGMINEILGKDIVPIYTYPKPGNIKHSLADISRAITFGYEPKGDLKEELKETIRCFANGDI